MARSRQERVDLACSQCGRPFQAGVWLIVDRAERPDLVRRLLQDELGAATCPHCGASGRIDHPLLFHDGEREQIVCAVPLSVNGQAAARELIGHLLDRLVAALPPENRRPYLREVEIVPEIDGLRAMLVEQALVEDVAADERQVAAALQELLNVAGQENLERVIAEHRRLLLGEGVGRLLDELRNDPQHAGDRELQRRLREARAILGRMRAIVAGRRQALASLLDEIAPLSGEELAVLPQLRQMLDAIDPQQVFAARIALDGPSQALLDELVDRLARQAEVGAPEALAFLRTLQSLPRQ